ncbi:hypothetical protein STRTUCAR8_05748 [Streptomyces turgidiscabies Car8]|uniref:Uncharacterized protein n=1 Tax=Streptomyces turgidiscabies (strain Car8) TaxID=698760 RepID=L7FCH3_STRT8|nr:hypothetical protein STRTUCAR8_05748 [Streptomyces turgidiscabies Car8]
MVALATPDEREVARRSDRDPVTAPFTPLMRYGAPVTVV